MMSPILLLQKLQSDSFTSVSHRSDNFDGRSPSCLFIHLSNYSLAGFTSVLEIQLVLLVFLTVVKMKLLVIVKCKYKDYYYILGGSYIYMVIQAYKLIIK